jgi:hypothetical protein
LEPCQTGPISSSSTPNRLANLCGEFFFFNQSAKYERSKQKKGIMENRCKKCRDNNKSKEHTGTAHAANRRLSESQAPHKKDIK